jgi:hypothetical protein
MRTGNRIFRWDKLSRLESIKDSVVDETRMRPAGARISSGRILLDDPLVDIRWSGNVQGAIIRRAPFF